MEKYSPEKMERLHATIKRLERHLRQESHTLTYTEIEAATIRMSRLRKAYQQQYILSRGL